MTLDRVMCLEAFRQAVEACDPEQLVANMRDYVLGPLRGPPPLGLAIGKAALKMARGAGPISRGIIVTDADDGLRVPTNWHVLISAHPMPDERSLAAADAVLDLIACAGPGDRVLALISGGASSLIERPAPGITLDVLRARVSAAMASGADIHAINALRTELSAIKGGKLARLCEVPIATLAISDVYDDDLATIGSGPTFANRPLDRAEVIAPMNEFRKAFVSAYIAISRIGGPWQMSRDDDSIPLRGSIADTVEQLLGDFHGAWDELRVRYGEPLVELPPDHGEGGRAQQLALALARRFATMQAVSAFVIGSDGIDGPAPAHRAAPAGAFVDETTWQRIADAGIDPERALARCGAGTALDAIGALVVTGPTGINHGDLMLVG